MLPEMGLPSKRAFAALLLLLFAALAAHATPKDGDSTSAEISTAAAAPDSSQPPSPAPADSRFSLAAQLNRRLPHWLQFDAEYRARLEDGTTLGKTFTASGQDTYFLNRIRVGVTIRPASWLKFYAQAQDVRSFDKNPPRSFAFYDLYDLRQGYMEIGDTEKGTVALRAGRQVFNWGEGRLVGESAWLFGSRTFDAVRFTLRHGGYRVDAFAASVVQILPVTTSGFSKPRTGNDIHGLYGGIEKLIPQAVIEPYVFWRIGSLVAGEDKKLGDLNFHAYGVRWVGKLPLGFDYSTEVAIERGKVADSVFSAWGGHWVVGHTWMRPMKPRFFVEYDYATGDHDPKDNRVQTFDTMYPSVHLKWGETDQVGWRNIHDVRGSLELVPGKNWTVSTNYHSYWLADTHDALYSGGGSVEIARVAAGTAGRWVGQELDAQAAHKFVSGLELGVGCGHIFPGTFIRHASGGHGYSYPYVMMTYTF
jgi:hypothetical protein